MKVFLFLLMLFFSVNSAQATIVEDSDRDGISDFDEINIYMTDSNNPDTDIDGFSDWTELNNGYSPHNAKKIKLDISDYDSDGLTDRMELNFKTNILDSDTDSDGFSDGDEIKNGYDPLNIESAKLPKRIEVNTDFQELSYFLGGVRMGKYKISSGKANSTPKGHFKIINKSPKAWSSYGLWMPYWMGLGNEGRWYGQFGIHELPVWPNGYREGENHLGAPVSHGCIRVGVGAAEFLYNWAEVNTPIFIY